MANFNIHPQDIPLLIHALQSLESVPDSWFGPVDKPTLIADMKNAARALPSKLQFKTLRFSDLDILALQQACSYQCLEADLSKKDYRLFEHYADQFAALLVAGNLGMLH